MIQTQASSSVLGLSSALEQVVASASPSVVRISSPRGHGTSGTVWSDDGLVLTTHSGTRRARSLGVRGADEREREATVLGRDPGTDLVLLRTDPEGLAPLSRAPADTLPKTGALSLALARPGWQLRASLRILGIVGPGFRTHRGGRIDAWLESDRALPRGFAGGPLVDLAGRMLGLDSRGIVRHADLAIPLSTIERVVAELLEHGAVRQGWLGISLVPVELPASDDRDPRGAVLVTGLDEEGPAAQAGIRIGDLILSVEGAAVEGPGALREALRGKAGASLQLDLERAGAAVSSQVIAGDTPD